MKSGLLNKVMVLAATGLALSSGLGCQKKVGSESISTRTSGPRSTVNGAYTNATAQGQLRGVIGTDPTYQSQFQQAVVGFLSTDVREDYVGQVSASPTQQSGVFFGGRVQLTTGSLRTLGSGYGQVATSSTFAIQVIDYVSQYSTVPRIPAFQFANASGAVSGTQAQITFSDTYGSVNLVGQLNTQTNMFEGTISYDNNIKIDGSTPGAAGTLGSFRIAICDFFVCN